MKIRKDKKLINKLCSRIHVNYCYVKKDGCFAIHSNYHLLKLGLRFYSGQLVRGPIRIGRGQAIWIVYHDWGVRKILSGSPYLGYKRVKEAINKNFGYNISLKSIAKYLRNGQVFGGQFEFHLIFPEDAEYNPDFQPRFYAETDTAPKHKEEGGPTARKSEIELGIELGPDDPNDLDDLDFEFEDDPGSN